MLHGQVVGNVRDYRLAFRRAHAICCFGLRAPGEVGTMSGSREPEEDFSDIGKIGAVYARLKGLVLENKLRPGHRLMADDLADRFRVSRTPVREALLRLSGENLILATPNRGHFCKPYYAEEQISLYELAQAVLMHSVRKNIAEFTVSGLSKPMEIEPDDEEGLVSNSEPFTKSHAMFIEQLFERIALLSGNKEILRVIRNFIDRTHTIRMMDLREPANVRVIAADMFDLIDALVGHDAEAAVANLGRQVSQKVQRLPELARAANEEAALAPFP